MATADFAPTGRLGEHALGPWVASPYRLVSLLEMLEFNATAFIQLSNLLTGSESHLLAISGTEEENLSEDVELSPRQEMALRSSKFVLSYLDEIKTQLELLGLDAAEAQVERIQAHYESDRLTVTNLCEMLKDLRLRISDQLAKRLFLFVPTEKARYYNGVALFGAEVEAKFPSTSDDISEAGKCLALHRATAAVFHLMRVMEIGVQALAGKLNVTYRKTAPWGEILGNIDDEIKRLRKTGMNVDELQDISASLHAAKDAWRNPTMHPKATHSEDNAENIFNACRVFMRLLEKVV